MNNKYKLPELHKIERRIKVLKNEINNLNVIFYKNSFEYLEYSIDSRGKYNRQDIRSHYINSSKISVRQIELNRLRSQARFLYKYNTQKRMMKDQEFLSQLQNILIKWKNEANKFSVFKYTEKRFEDFLRIEIGDNLFYIVNSLRETLYNCNNDNEASHVKLNNETLDFLRRYDLVWWYPN